MALRGRCVQSLRYFRARPISCIAYKALGKNSKLVVVQTIYFTANARGCGYRIYLHMYSGSNDPPPVSKRRGNKKGRKKGEARNGVSGARGKGSPRGAEAPKERKERDILRTRLNRGSDE